MLLILVTILKISYNCLVTYRPVSYTHLPCPFESCIAYLNMRYSFKDIKVCLVYTKSEHRLVPPTSDRGVRRFGFGR